METGGGISMVNRFALVAARREPPFHNLGAEGVDYYMDFEIDGRRLRDLVEQAVDDHDDVICPLTPEVPEDSLSLIDALLGRNDLLSAEYGIEKGEVPIYVCRIDYDVLCGAYVARLDRSSERVLLHSFRYISTDDDAIRDVTAKVSGLQFEFAADQFDEVLLAARAVFAAIRPTPQTEPPPKRSWKQRWRIR